MGHSHGLSGAATSGPPESAAGKHRGRLKIAFALTALMFVAELVVGLLAHSLAVIADAGHLAADVVTLGAALLATHIAARSVAAGRWTYGRYRAEVFAAGLAVLLMLGVGVFVVVGAISRIGTVADIDTGLMGIIGVIGLAVNIVALLLLRAGSRESLNVRGAYLEVMADAAGSVGVIAAAALIFWTSWTGWDVVIAIAIGAFVVVRALGLGRSVLRVLGQRAPTEIDPTEVAAALAAIDGVDSVHDMHIWELTSGMTVATAHLVAVADSDWHGHHTVLDAARDLLAGTYRIEHATLQIEPGDHTYCGAIDW